MRPSGSTAAASVNISAAPPVAILPRCTKCQSSAMPSRAEYWHIGEMTTRFLRVMPRRVSGENSSGLDDIEFLLTGRCKATKGGKRQVCAESCSVSGAEQDSMHVKYAAGYARDIGGNEGRVRDRDRDRPFQRAQH